ncbi:uncharacterized protein [Pocillopora verrucosa]|uniref:uncharacterized protein n=1 Tax=Pocillopora verrucosa TaxID=203993 RepID=UPI0027971582|nr:uncharacterized protein LOC131781031 [Pocillopora verrucosa]
MASSSTRPQSNDWVHYCFKVIIIGDYKVGKTSLLCKYTGHQYRSPSSTISVDFRAKNLERNGKRVKLQIWDIAGQERFRTAVASYYRGAVGVILVYDVTNRESFRNIGYWHEQMRKFCDPHAKGILVGNRCHLSHLREVQAEEGKTFAEHLELPFFETSTEKNINVIACFDELVDSIIEQMERGRQIRELTTLVLPASGEENRNVEACACTIL